jgi:hypothetical protein
MLRNEYVVIEVTDRNVRLRQTLPPFEFIVSKSGFEPAIVADIAIGGYVLWCRSRKDESIRSAPGKEGA